MEKLLQRLVVRVSDVGLDERSEGARWGMPHKRALFGPEGQDRVSSVRVKLIGSTRVYTGAT